MSPSLPMKLICAWALLFGFVLAHAHHERRMRAFLSQAPLALFRAVEISSLAGLFAMTGIMIYYFVVTTWYWTIALGLGGAISGAVFAGIGFGLMGEDALSKRAFVGWPLSAIWAVTIIHGINA